MKLDAPMMERLIAAVALAGLLALIGVLLHQAVSDPEDPLPRITLEVERVVEDGDGWLTIVRAHNAGSAGAVDLVVEGDLEGEGSSREIRQATLAELPPRSQRRAALRWTGDPRSGRLALRVVGFALP